MPSTIILPRWYKAVVASDIFNWNIYKQPKKPSGPCYEIQFEYYGVDHDGYCSGYSDNVDSYLDRSKPEDALYLKSTSYTTWLPLTDSDGAEWDFDAKRFKDSNQNACFSESGSGCCRIHPVIMLSSVRKID